DLDAAVRQLEAVEHCAHLDCDCFAVDAAVPDGRAWRPVGLHHAFACLAAMVDAHGAGTGFGQLDLVPVGPELDDAHGRPLDHAAGRHLAADLVAAVGLDMVDGRGDRDQP